MLNLEFISTEFTIKGTTDEYRIDTLAFDNINKAFVIIEYKNKKNASVVDQGFCYLSVMLNRKADFILKYIEQKGTAFKNIDWSQSRVLFIAEDFTPYQRESINFKSVPIILYKIKRFSNDTITFDELKPNNPTDKLTMLAPLNPDFANIDKEIKVYTESDHTAASPKRIVDIYEQIKEEILNLGSVEIKVTKLYIAFTVQGRNFVDITLQQKGLKIWLNLHVGDLIDPYGIARDVSKCGHYGNGDYEIHLKTTEILDYVLTLIRQSFNKKSKSF